MRQAVNDYVRELLCPEDIWQFSNQMNQVYKNAIRKFPLKQVTVEQERYPTTADGMGAYLDKFFARHYFQVQESFLNYMTSDQYLSCMANGQINILDIGSGPAVASLAITDLTTSIARATGMKNKIRLNFVLNDTSGICLGLGKELLSIYFGIPQDLKHLSFGRTFLLNEKFPKTFVQFERIAKSLRPFDIIVFSYVLTPLREQRVNISQRVEDLKRVCSDNGKILIVQDKYKAEMMSNLLDETEQNSVTHTVYSKQNDNESYTYDYCQCLI